LPTAFPENVTAQLEVGLPAMSVQEPAGVNVSPEPVEEKDTIPAGLDFTPAVSTSVTLAVTVPPWPARSGLGETVTAVAVARAFTFSGRPAWLVWNMPETPA
jgi:hypothetical protein